MIEDAILEHFSEMPDTFVTSSSKRVGGQALLDYIANVNQAYKNYVGK